MKNPSLAVPLALIIIGALWFLKTTDILPATSTLVAVGLLIAGAAVLLLDGINKQSVVSGPMLIYTGAAVYLHSQAILPRSPLIALGMMILGALLLFARSHLVPPKSHRFDLPENNPRL